MKEGCHNSVLVPAQDYRIRIQNTVVEWPLEIEGCLGDKYRRLSWVPATEEMRTRLDAKPLVGGATVLLPRLEAEPAPEPPAVEAVEITPPFHGRWMATAPAGPAERMVHASSALDPATLVAPRLGVVIEILLARPRFHEAAACASPVAEPVATFVLPSLVLTPVEASLTAQGEGAALEIPDWKKTLPLAGVAAAPAVEPVLESETRTVTLEPIAAAAEQPEVAALQIPDWKKALPLAPAAVSPAAEPVAEFVRLAAALTPVEMAAAACIAPAFGLSTAERAWNGAAAVAAPDAQPAERFLYVASNLTPAVCATHELRLQQPEIAAEIEPLPVPDEPLVIPAACLQAMPGPAAEPVCRMVYSSEASFITAALPVALPAPALEPAMPYVPLVAATKAAGKAEAVMSGVQPRIASVLVTPISVELLLALPGIPSLTQELFALANPAQAPAAQPAETLVIAAEKAVPAPVAAEFRVPDAAAMALAHRDAAPSLAGPLASLEAQPLESMMVASSADSMSPKARLQALEFTIEASGDLLTPDFDTERMAPAAAQPETASPKVFELRPISTISVKAPAQEYARFLPTLPEPGMLPVEFHTQRVRGVLHERPEWKTSRIPATPPKFTVRPVFGKLEEPTPMPKPAKQEPEFVKTFSNPVKRPSKTLLLAGQIAAAVLLASSLWYAYSIRGRISNGVVEVASAPQEMPSSGRSEVAAVTRSTAPAAPASGPVAWVRQTLAKRASAEVTDHFRDGMTGWGSKDSATAPAWTHHPDGYIIPSSLAFFRPSMKFTDYRLEFFGQIEKKGMSWSVRSKDANNYHAMRVAVTEAGLRPFVALVHWDVINGKAGKESRTPLNIMVHNNRPMQVAVEVDGNRLVTSIDGEEVDTSTYTSLASGGVGFFADANERARLYWMKVSKNDDWLGHVCGFLAGDEATRATAELRGPQFPGDAPAPGLPGEDNTLMAAAWAGLPYLRAAQKNRTSKKTRRTERWNT